MQVGSKSGTQVNVMDDLLMCKCGRAGFDLATKNLAITNSEDVGLTLDAVAEPCIDTREEV